MAGRRLAQPLRRFLGDQRGNAAIVFAFPILPLAAGAGLAIDTMLAYSVEDQLQKSLDAAGLAAGATALPENVEADAQNYFSSNFNAGADLAELEDFDVEVSDVGDELTLTATAVMPTRFMRLFGQDTVTVSASTTINREIRQMELALVLDNTGSMVGAKFTTMQAAALDLVDIVYGDVETNPNLFVAVVPYTAVVNIGAGRWNWLHITDPEWLYRSGVSAVNPYAPTAWKGCVLARLLGLDQTDDPPSVAAFRSYLYPDDSDNNWDGSPNTYGAAVNPDIEDWLTAYNDGYGPNLGCGPVLTPLVQSKSDVEAALNNMGPWHRGGTAGNEGLAWGWRVLSPRWRGLWGGDTPNTRPLDYDASDTDKVVVMLTDGNNDVYDHNGGGPRGSDYTAFGRLHDATFMGPGTTATIPQGRNNLNARMTTICNRVKAEGILIYTITFGTAPNAATQTLYRACATRPEFYYHSPDNGTLRTVFRTIGVQLSNLRIAR
jgi:Flp pilus assembly protein TadG